MNINSRPISGIKMSFEEFDTDSGLWSPRVAFFEDLDDAHQSAFEGSSYPDVRNICVHTNSDSQTDIVELEELSF